VLADFYSTTCGPCHMMHPILERLASRRAGEIAVIRINVEYHQDLAREFGVQGVTTFVIVHKGAERGRAVGAMDESGLPLGGQPDVRRGFSALANSAGGSIEATRAGHRARRLAIGPGRLLPNAPVDASKFSVGSSRASGMFR
jgi:thiol-disulfide isomerase/thioredoxin